VSVEEKESGSGAVLWMSEEAMLSASVSTGNLVAVRPLIRSLFVCILPPLEDSLLLSSRVWRGFFSLPVGFLVVNSNASLFCARSPN